MFIAHIWQNEACDYSIKCGHKIVELEATTQNDAFTELHKLVVGIWNPADYSSGWEGGYWDEKKLLGAMIYEVADKHEMATYAWYSEAVSKTNKYKQSEKEQDERAEYERLRAKFDA